MSDHIQVQALQPGMEYRLTESSDWIPVRGVGPSSRSHLLIITLRDGSNRWLRPTEEVQINVPVFKTVAEHVTVNCESCEETVMVDTTDLSYAQCDNCGTWFTIQGR